MSCFKCGSNHLGSRKYTIKELAKGSPTRGKNMKFNTVKVFEIKCRDCQSTECKYD